MGILDSLKKKSGVYDEIEEPIKVAEPIRTPPPKPQVQPQRQTTASRPPVFGALSMQVLRPTSFGESPRVADCLKAGQAVVLNLEDMEESEARRMIDYVAGVLYGILSGACVEDVMAYGNALSAIKNTVSGDMSISSMEEVSSVIASHRATGVQDEMVR